MERLEGRVAFITGGGSGIGQASALRMASEGAAIMVADINLESARDTAARIGEAGGVASALEVDVTAEAQVKAALEETVSELGGLHIVMNNAGGGGPGIGWDGSVDLNLSGVYYGLLHGCELLAQNDGGAVVNTSSIAGLTGLLTLPREPDPDSPDEDALAGRRAYIAAKHGVMGLTRQFALDYAGRGVRVNAVNPGYILTPLLDPVTEDPQAIPFLESLHPMGRLGQPEEIAAAAAFLASDDASFITGVALPVDGGYMAR